jgi:DNA-binding protein HU-beta
LRFRSVLLVFVQFQGVFNNQQQESNMAKAVTPKTKSQIIAAIAEEAQITKAQATAALASLVGLTYKGAKSEEGFTIPGIGKLIKVQRKARTGRNPATGEAIKIKAKKTLKFRIAKAAKDAVL